MESSIAQSMSYPNLPQFRSGHFEHGGLALSALKRSENKAIGKYVYIPSCPH